MFSSFRARLFILLLLGVLPCLGLVLYRNFEQRRIETARVREDLVATARLSAANEENFIAHTRQILATLTQFPFLTLTTDRGFAHTNLFYLRNLNPDYLNFGLIETNGLLFCSSEPFTNAVDLGDRPYFRRVIQTHNFSAGDFQVGRITGRPGLNFAYPVLDQGRLQRVIYASLPLSLFTQRLSHIPLLPGAAITVLDRSGTIVACFPGGAKWTGQSWSGQPVFSHIVKLKQGIFESTGPDGIKRLNAVTAVYDVDSPGLFINVDVPVRICYEQANRNLARNLIFLAGVAVLIFLAAHYYSTRFFLHPVRELARAASQLAAGDLHARVGAITGSAELAQLGHAFDDMATRLQKRQTELENAQEQIRTINEQLDARVKDRTVALEAANKELEAFSYSVSHDLRAPLRHISGFVHFLEQKGTSLDPDSLRFIGFIGEAARQMNELVEDLLNFSHMSRAEVRLAEVDANQLIDEVRRSFEPELNGRAIQWTVQKLPAVRADPVLLRLVLTNLMGNAIKYTRPRNPAHIEIGSNNKDGENIIYVRDNGVGFDMQHARKLFGVFQRFHHSDDFEGTGIGLATVQRIILRMGGRVWAEARENEGATFYFSLPKQMSNAGGHEP